VHRHTPTMTTTLYDLPNDTLVNIIQDMDLPSRLSFLTSNKSCLLNLQKSYEECHDQMYEYMIERDILFGKTFKSRFVIRYSYKFLNYLFIFNGYCRFQVVNKYTRVFLKDYIVQDIKQVIADFKFHIKNTLKAREICSLIDDKFKVDLLPLGYMETSEKLRLEKHRKLYPYCFCVGNVQ